MGLIADLFESFTARSPWSHSRRLEKVLPLLDHDDPAKRKEACEALDGFSTIQFIRPFKIPFATGVRILKAAAKVPVSDDFAVDLPSKLLRFLWDAGRPEYLPVIEEIYDSLQSRKEGRESVLRILTEMQTADSLDLLNRLLGRASSRTVDPLWIFVPLKPSKLLAESFLPGFLKVIPNLESKGGLYTFVHSFAEAGCWDMAGAAEFGIHCQARVAELLLRHEAFAAQSQWLDRLDPRPEKDPEADELAERFDQLEVLADLLGYMRSSGSTELLRKISSVNSFRLKAFAVGSMLRLGAPVEDSLLKGLTAHPRSRGLLWTVLESVGALERFPWDQRSQEKLAEAKMCEWLEFPTELGCAPHEIRKFALVRTAQESGNVLVYFFKFRRDQEWKVGWAGPYPEGGPPTYSARDTFSKFSPLEKMTLEEHIRDCIGEETLFTIVERGD